VNPRASRTIPFISKITNIPFAKYAAQIAAGKKIKDLNFTLQATDLIAVKKPVFPFNKFPSQNVFLSPEMKSTGEVIGFDISLGSAYAKAELGAGNKIPNKGKIFVSVNDSDKPNILKISRDLNEMAFTLIATYGTAQLLLQNGIQCDTIYKVGEGRPHIVDAIKNKEIQFIINTPLGAQSRYDEYEIGKAAIQHSIPMATTISGAEAALRGIRTMQYGKLNYKSLQEIF
jgi:carbamoyl-phosphate synthase large subunit